MLGFEVVKHINKTVFSRQVLWQPHLSFPFLELVRFYYSIYVVLKSGYTWL